MKKYKLIKEYPGSLSINTVVELINIYSGYYKVIKTKDSCYSNTLSRNTIENFPDNWQEVVEKEYEILSIIDTSTSWIYKLIKDSNIFRYEREYNVLELTLNSINNQLDDSYKIHSVKRLSDGEVFTIDQLIYSKFWGASGNIIKLHLVGETLYYDSKNGNKQFSSVISDLHIIKQKLFTTEDGVDVFEKDEIYVVSKIHFIISNWTSQCLTSSNLNPNYLSFSTKEKAEEYIILNKPCLSYNDLSQYLVKVCDIGIANTVIVNHQILKELIKSKLNIK